MKTLIVLAHPEPDSFTASLARHGAATLRGAGHDVDLADLYRMRFDPISDRRNFRMAANADQFDQQLEERFAADHDSFAPSLQVEMDRLAACDLLILQFPIWWLGMPAIMKGWIDRVFAIGRTYGGGRWFDRGWMRGKQAMLAVTIGGTEQAYSRDGIYGPVEDVLRPINHGILRILRFRRGRAVHRLCPRPQRPGRADPDIRPLRAAPRENRQCSAPADDSLRRLRTVRTQKIPCCVALTSVAAMSRPAMHAETLMTATTPALTDFEALSFDCYGTLIDWETGLLAALEPLLARAAARPPTDDVLEAYGAAEFEAEQAYPGDPYPRILSRVWQALASEWEVADDAEERERFAQSVGEWPAFPDTVEALSA